MGGTVPGAGPEEFKMLQILLDTGALGHSYISAKAAAELPHLKRASRKVTGTLADGSEWSATEVVEVPLRLILKPMGVANVDMRIEMVVMKHLPCDIILGTDAIVEYRLFKIIEAVLQRYENKDRKNPKVSLAVKLVKKKRVLAAVPFLVEREDDGFGELMAYPMDRKILSTPLIQTATDWPEGVELTLVDMEHLFENSVKPEPGMSFPEFMLVEEEAVDKAPLRGKLRPQSPEHEDEIRKQVAKLLDLNVIEVYSGQHYSQVLLVKKPDGSLRFCVDYRFVNKITKMQYYPLPNIANLLQRLGGNSWFSVLDLTSGYHQCPVAKESRHLTAFITAGGVYQFKRVPFGLKQAPGYFQKVMQDHVLRDYIPRYCVVYIDDVIIFAKSREELVRRTRLVLKRFEQHNLTLNPKKCRLCVRSVEYVGHRISEDGVEITSKRKEAINQMRQPETISELRSFLGVTNYVREFIPRYAEVTKALYDLIPAQGQTKLKKVKKLKVFKTSKKLKPSNNKKPAKSPISWNAEAEVAFQAVKDAIVHSCTLKFLADEGEVRLYTDASDYAIGAHLVQVDETGVERTVAFYSKKLNDVQSRWNVTEKEMFSVIEAVHKFHTYIGGRHFVVMTDHRNLIFWQTVSDSAKVERWRQKLSIYDYTMRHLPGVENCMADSLSRLIAPVVTRKRKLEQNPATTLEGKRGPGDSSRSSTFEDSVERAEVVEDFPERVAADEQEDDPLEEPDSALEPEEIIRRYHGGIEGHFKVKTTYERMKRHGHHWKNMYQDVVKFVDACIACQKTAIAASGSHGPSFDLHAAEPFDHVSIDLTGELEMDAYGFKYVLVIIDHMSRFVWLYPLKSKDSPEVARKLLELICLWGTPKRLHSDGGGEFVSAVINETLKLLDVPQTVSIPYSHQDNGKVERAIRDVKNQLMAYLVEADLVALSWSDVLPCIARIMNSRVMMDVKFAPADIIFGKINRLDFPSSNSESDPKGHEYVKAISAYQNKLLETHAKVMEKVRQAKAAKGLRDPTTFEPGDIILVDRKTVEKKNIREPLRDGPFLVVDQKDGEVSYEDYTKTPCKIARVHVSFCRHYVALKDAMAELQAARAKYGNYEVESIVSHHYSPKNSSEKSNLRFVVKWVGYDELSVEKGYRNKQLTKTAAVQRYIKDHPSLEFLKV